MPRSLASLPESVQRAVLRKHPELAGGIARPLGVPQAAASPLPTTPKPSGGGDRAATGKRRGVMNKTEARYAARLDAQGDPYTYEGLTMTSAGLRYTPDFVVARHGIAECHEVKARWKNGKVGWKGASRARFTAAKKTWGHLFAFRVFAWDGNRFEEVEG